MADQDKSSTSRIAYWLRDRLNAELFSVIATDERDVLDVGGGGFFHRLRARNQSWRSYSVVEPAEELLPAPDSDVTLYVASAEDLPFPDSSFDVILAIQVLEHVFDPIAATREMFRCLRPGGDLIILVPQSGTLHLVPHHYQNLTRFWLFEQARRLGATVTYYSPQGGSWRTIASRLFLMFWPILDLHQTRDDYLPRRTKLFWLTLPLQLLVAAIMFPVAMLLSFADIAEEANNHLMVLTKNSTE